MNGLDPRMAGIGMSSGSNLDAAGRGISLGPAETSYGTTGASVAPSVMAPAQPAGRPFGESLSYMLEAFGAGMAGKPSMLEREVASARKDKEMKLAELKVKADLFENGLKSLKGTYGEERARIAAFWANDISKADPTWGQSFATLAADKPFADLFPENIQGATTAMGFMKIDPTGRLLHDQMQIPAVAAIIRDEVKTAAKVGVTKKVNTIVGNLNILDATGTITPEEQQAIKKGGITLTEILAFSERLSKHPNKSYQAAALSDGEIEVLIANEAVVLQGTDVFTGASTQANLRDANKPPPAGEESPMARANRERGNVITEKQFKATEAKLTHIPREAEPKGVTAGEYTLADGSKINHSQMVQQYKLENNLLDSLDLKILQRTDPARAATERAKIEAATPFPDWAKSKFGVDVRGGAGGAPGGAVAPKASAEMPTVKTKAEFDALKVGSKFIDGRTGKPSYKAK